MTSEPEEPVKESTTAEKGSSEVAEPEPAAPPAPTKSKVQLWNEIKILCQCKDGSRFLAFQY